MEYFLHIKATFDCVAKIYEKDFEIEDGQTKDFLLKTQDEKFVISFYPTNDKMGEYLPYSAKFDLKNRKISNKNVEFIEFPNDNLFLIAKPFRLKYPRALSLSSKNLFFGSKNHNLYYFKNDLVIIRIENQSKEFINIDYDSEIEDIYTKTNENYAILYAKTITDKFFVCVVEYKGGYKIAKKDEFDLLEVKKDKILVYKNLNNACHHGKTYEISTNKPFVIKENLVYNDDDFVQKQKELVPKAFFDAIKNKDFSLARKFLSFSLSENLKDEHLKEYFGDFCDTQSGLDENADYKKIALIYEKNGKKSAKIYNLEFENDKIANILEE